MIEERAAHLEVPGEVLAEMRPRLERALVARYGIPDGLDAAADAMAYAVEHWDDLRTMQNPAGYLYRVGQTAGGRLARRWSRQGALVAEPWGTDAVVDVDLQRALLRLKPDERVAIVLVHAHGHTYAEAAAMLDIPVTTVTNHLTRGLARLRRTMER